MLVWTNSYLLKSFFLLTSVCNQVAGIACKHVIVNFALGAFGEIYHFPNAGKKINYSFSSIFACFFSLEEYVLEPFPLSIAQKLAYFPCTPAFLSLVYVGYCLELLEKFQYLF